MLAAYVQNECRARKHRKKSLPQHDARYGETFKYSVTCKLGAEGRDYRMVQNARMHPSVDAVRKLVLGADDKVAEIVERG
jgi:hypothetical protein